MIMSEDKVIHLILPGKLIGKLIQRLVLTTEHIFLMTGQPVSARPAVAQSESQPRMEKAEKELEHTVMEDSAKEAVSHRNRPQAVSVTKAEGLSSYLDQGRLHESLHSKFLEILIGPHIMVSLKEKDFHSPVHKTLESGKDPYVSFRNDVTVFVPEIPYVTQQIQGSRILRKRAQKVRETTFALLRVSHLKTEMDI